MLPRFTSVITNNIHSGSRVGSSYLTDIRLTSRDSHTLVGFLYWVKNERSYKNVSHQ